MKQIEVQIMQQSYVLSCPEDQEVRMLQAVERVDNAMIRIRDGGKVRARERIAVLAALNLAFEFVDREAHLQAEAQADAQALAQAQADALLAPPAEAAALSDEDTQLQQLIQRLDVALGEDGRLF